MQLGKIGKGLTAALVGGALLWPASSAEKPYENIHNYSRPAMAYAAETAAKPATTSGIRNETGKQYNYKSGAPYSFHFPKLTAGVNPAKVNELDKNDYYHYVDRADGSDLVYVKIPKGSWIRGDVMDVLRKVRPDTMTIDQFNGQTLTPGQEYSVLIANWIQDCHLTAKKAERIGKDGKVERGVVVSEQKVGGTGKRYQYTTDNFVVMRNLKTGKEIRPETHRTTNTYPGFNKDKVNSFVGRPSAGYETGIRLVYDNPSYTVFDTEIYESEDWALYWVFNPKGFPSNDYSAEFNTAQGKRTVKFNIENPNKPDPKIAMALGEKYTFQNEDMDFDLFRSDISANIAAGFGRSRVFDLAGTVNIVIPDVLPKEIERSSIKIRLAENGVITRDIYEAQLTHEPHTWTFDTTQLENGEYGVYIDLGHTNGYILRNVRIQNQPLVASQPKE